MKISFHQPNLASFFTPLLFLTISNETGNPLAENHYCSVKWYILLLMHNVDLWIQSIWSDTLKQSFDFQWWETVESSMLGALLFLDSAVSEWSRTGDSSTSCLTVVRLHTFHTVMTHKIITNALTFNPRLRAQTYTNELSII